MFQIKVIYLNDIYICDAQHFSCVIRLFWEIWWSSVWISYKAEFAVDQSWLKLNFHGMF